MTPYLTRNILTLTLEPNSNLSLTLTLRNPNHNSSFPSMIATKPLLLMVMGLAGCENDGKASSPGSSPGSVYRHPH